MRKPVSAACALLPLFLAFSCSAQDPVGTSIERLPPGDKIDAPLAAAMRPDARVPVLVLGRTQLIAGADGFTQFTRRHANADRLALRQTVVAELKRIAAREQASLLPADLPAAAGATGLWIVNGVIASLTQSEIVQASNNENVAYLYRLTQLPAPTPTGTAPNVAPVRSPFSVSNRRIAWNVERIGAPAAWQQNVTGEGIVIALIDAGVAVTHSDLKNNIWVNADEVAGNGVDDDGNGYIDDRHGYNFTRNSPDVGQTSVPHGTFVAGILVGDGSGGTITGVAPRARLMPLDGVNFASLALAYQYAIENGADVLNMSFSVAGQGNLRGAYRMASDHAVAAGLVLASGAGNFQQSEQTPVQLRIPEDIPSVIAVGGVDPDLRVTDFSSLGPVEWGTVRFYQDHRLPTGLVKPDVVAFPGAGYPVLNTAGGYVDPNSGIRGNSFSGPQAAGAAALLLSAAPATPAWRISEILQSTARDLESPGKDNRTGAGLIDVAAALNRIRQPAASASQALSDCAHESLPLQRAMPIPLPHVWRDNGEPVYLRRYPCNNRWRLSHARIVVVPRAVAERFRRGRSAAHAAAGSPCCR